MSINGEQSECGEPTPLDLEHYTPFYISNIANRWTAAASRAYLKEFGIGITEWRVLASLSVNGQATSLEIVNLISMDAAAVSRGMKNLEDKVYVIRVDGRFRGRSKPFTMTTAGSDLFEKMRERALGRENTMLGVLTSKERGEFLTLLRKVHSRIGNL